jgi:hypothetical protein
MMKHGRKVMERRAVLSLILVLMSVATPVFPQDVQEKVICEIAAKNCLNTLDIIKKRMKKMDVEIKKGSRTYSAEDMKKLEQKLQETRDLLDKMEGKTPAK